MKTILFVIFAIYLTPLFAKPSPSLPAMTGIYETKCNGVLLRVLVIDDAGNWASGHPGALLKSEYAVALLLKVRKLTSKRLVTEVCAGEDVRIS